MPGPGSGIPEHKFRKRVHDARREPAFPTCPNSASSRCAICGGSLGRLVRLAHRYRGLVCRWCDQRAVDGDNIPALHESAWLDPDTGVINLFDPSDPNPVFIDRVRCWRRYKFGGFVTMRDPGESSSIKEFYESVGFFQRR